MYTTPWTVMQMADDRIARREADAEAWRQARHRKPDVRGRHDRIWSAAVARWLRARLRRDVRPGFGRPSPAL
jgi:hypothetical protein